jgi:hypothetical protein
MRVLIRERDGSRFLADHKQWVPTRERGLDFVSTVMAQNVARRMGLKHIEIVLDFGAHGQDVVLSVQDNSKDPPRVG